LTGKSRNKTWSSSAKIAVFAPMPSARVKMAITANPGLFASMRAP
jgi:hypothetical protein